jgi:hypothetical protein
MSAVPNSSEALPHKLGLAAGVTAENYVSKAKNFMDLHQKDGLFGVMLDRFNDQLRWDSWATYFRRKRIKHAGMRRAQKYMVPADFPQNFDGEWA